jgi:hypothetical protein
MARKLSAPVISLTSYLEYVKAVRSAWIGDLKQNYGDSETIWFRGHTSVEWRLTPKLYRREYKGAQEEEIRQEFQIRAQQLMQGQPPVAKWDWYFLMQHYGAPTRLLDWTDNPLVALYFAVAENNGETDAAVWMLSPWWLNRKLRRGIEGPMLPDWSEANSYLPDLEEAFSGRKVWASLPAAIDPPHVDRRLAAQGSRFLIFGKGHDLLKSKPVVASRNKSRKIQMLRIPKESVSDILSDLEMCGVTGPLLFPDLAALGKDLCRKCRNKG